MSGSIDLGISYIGSLLGYTPLTLRPQMHLSLAELYAAKGENAELRAVLELLANLPPHDLRLELRLWGELQDPSVLLAFSKRDIPLPLRHLALGLSKEHQNPKEAVTELKKAAQEDLWEAYLGLYRILKEDSYLHTAARLAPKTAEVGLYTAQVALPDPQAKAYLLDLSSSPVVFAQVRKAAHKIVQSFSR